jgi:hypothetical protein
MNAPTLAMLAMAVGCLLVILNQNAQVTRWPVGGPAWRFYVGHTLAWGGFITLGILLV